MWRNIPREERPGHNMEQEQDKGNRPCEAIGPDETDNRKLNVAFDAGLDIRADIKPVVVS
jgi:hypothetical protein